MAVDPQDVTPALANGEIPDPPTIADYDGPEYVLQDDTLSKAEKIRILENWMPSKNPELNPQGQTVEGDQPYARRVKLALEAVKNDLD